MDYKTIDVKSNSISSKANAESRKDANKTERAEKVTSGEVTVKKKSGSRKFLNSFISGDATDVKDYIVTDVLIPAMKNLLQDAISNTVSMFLYGEASNRNSRGGSGGTNYTVYSRTGSSAQRQRGRGYSRDVMDIGELEFESRLEAEDVLDGLYTRLERYRETTVLDLYDLAGLPCPNYRADKYGWTRLAGARVRQSGRGYVLDLPTPEYLG